MKKFIFGISIILLLAVSTSASAGYPDRDGTVAYWTFNEGIGNIAHDISGNENNGTIYGAVWAGGKVGKALVYDGIDDYIDAGDDESLNINNSESLTIESWIKKNSSLQVAKIVNKGQTWLGTPPNAGYSLMFVTIEGGHSSDSIRYTVIDGNENTIVTEYPDSNLNENEWYHIAGVLDRNGQKVCLYVNGVEVDNKNLPKGFCSLETNIPVGIGALHRGTFGPTEGYFNGTIDEVRILNRSLTPEEIMEDYRSTKQLFLTTNKVNYTLGETVKLNIEINYTAPSVFASFKLKLQEPSGMPDTIIQTKLFALNPGFYKNVTLSYPIPVNMWITDGEYSFTGSLIDSFGNIIESDSARFFVNDSMPAKTNLNFI